MLHPKGTSCRANDECLILNEKDPKLCSVSNKDLLGDSDGIIYKTGENVK